MNFDEGEESDSQTTEIIYRTPIRKRFKYLVLTSNNPELIINSFKRRPWWDSGESSNFHFLWVAFPTFAHFDKIKKLGKDRVAFNHFPEIDRYLTSKTGLYYSLKKYLLACKRNPFNFIPWTCVLRKSDKNSEYNRFLARYAYYQGKCKVCGLQEIDDELTNRIYVTKTRPSRPTSKKMQKRKSKSSEQQVPPHKHDPYENIWIVKPSGGSQGKNIQLFNDINRLLTYVKNSEGNMVIQKYIENPHLYRGRKYDIRAFGLLTTINDGKGLAGYHYKDAYLRTSSEEYDVMDFENLSIHLTNDHIQRQNDNFGIYEDSNKITMVGYKEYFMEVYGCIDGEMKYQYIRDQMKSIMYDCYSATFPYINQDHSTKLFQLLGFDFIVDAKLKVYLLEINTNAGMSFNPDEQPFKQDLFPRMMEEIFQLTVDVYFPERRELLPTDVIWTRSDYLQEEEDNGDLRFTKIFVKHGSDDDFMRSDDYRF